MPLHRQTCFAGHAPAPCPGAEQLATEVISLPCFPGLLSKEQDAVIEAVGEAISG